MRRRAGSSPASASLLRLLLSLQVARAEDAAAPAPPGLPPVLRHDRRARRPRADPGRRTDAAAADLPAVVVSVPPAEAAQAARPPEDLLPPRFRMLP